LPSIEGARARHLRVFLSSPQDVREERGIAARVLTRLPYDPFLRSRVTLEIVAWDGPVGNVPMTATSTPQAAIDRGLARPSECDIVVVILWNRMGTPLPDTYRRVDGTRYGSGTEWEYEEAVTAKDPPQVLIYRRIDPTRPESGGDLEALQQREQVERFFRGFHNEDGSLRGGVNTYRDGAHFEQQLEYHLREILSRLVSPNAVRDGQAVQACRLDAATPAHATLAQATMVHVQLCQLGSPGVLRDRLGTGPDAAAESTQSSSSQVPIVFQRDDDKLLPAIVHLDIVAPHHEPTRSTQSVLLPASEDSPVVSFSLEPQQPGLSRIHVTAAQDLAGGARVTCGTVIVESTVGGSRPDGVEQLWSIATRLIGAGMSSPQGSVPRATLTLRIVEDAERRIVEKYLTLEVSQLCSILAATRTDGGTIFAPSGQQRTGLELFENIKPALQALLSEDSDLAAFLEKHPEIGVVDLVLLLEDRVAAAWPMYSARAIGAIIVKTGLLEVVKRRFGSAHHVTGPQS
jgi:hypothetical protein